MRILPPITCPLVVVADEDLIATFDDDESLDALSYTHTY
jgi:hypothetical protein